MDVGGGFLSSLANPVEGERANDDALPLPAAHRAEITQDLRAAGANKRRSGEIKSGAGRRGGRQRDGGTQSQRGNRGSHGEDAHDWNTSRSDQTVPVGSEKALHTGRSGSCDASQSVETATGG